MGIQKNVDVAYSFAGRTKKCLKSKDNRWPTDIRTNDFSYKNLECYSYTKWRNVRIKHLR